jgi:hypothetical protein
MRLPEIATGFAGVRLSTSIAMKWAVVTILHSLILPRGKKEIKRNYLVGSWSQPPRAS